MLNAELISDLCQIVGETRVSVSRAETELYSYDASLAKGQPGVTNLELQNALASLGFFYAPDPASQKVATLGGNVGENSGGPRCLKYGVTTNHILGLDVVLSSGEILRLGGCAYDPPGYDLRGALIGSEGTMGIVTEVTVRILPLPQKIITLLVVYDDIGNAAQSVSDIISAGILPTTLEMMDAPIINAVEDSYACGYPRDAAAVLIVEVEGLSVGLKDQVTRISELCRLNHCREIREAKDDAQRNRLWEGRRGAFGAVARLAPNYLVNDCTVPRTKLPEALARVAEIVAKYDFKHGNVFHAGDGNLHPLIFFDSRDTDQLKRVKKAGWEIMQACVELGGTISGEHGVGLEKIDAMRLVFSELDFIAQRGVQQAFDPDRLLNPGKVIPLSPPEESSHEIPSRSPFVATPYQSAAEKEIGEIIQNAAAGGKGLIPTGCGSFLHFGNLPSEDCGHLNSAVLDNIYEFDPYNQFVSVGAGVGLDVLQRQLAEQHQWLPIRPVLALQDHSIGGVMALAACGPERMHYGAPRDLVLGLHYMNGSGLRISAGGKVVKNVAGYDMTRLMIGSAGTLGLITEVTCRVMTIPERCSAIDAEGPLSTCAALASEVVTSQLIPVFIVMMPENGQGDEVNRRHCKLKIGFEGFDKIVNEQLARTHLLCEQVGLTLNTEQDYSVQAGIFNNVYAELSQAAFILRADLPFDQMIGFVEEIDEQVPATKLFLDVGCGRILAGFEGMPDGLCAQLCDVGDRLGGHVIMEKASAEFKTHNDVFGVDRPQWKVMHRIKAALDPEHVFSPGRLPGKV